MNKLFVMQRHCPNDNLQIDKAGKGMDRERRSHDNQEVAFHKVCLHAIEESLGQVFSEENDIWLYECTTSAFGYHHFSLVSNLFCKGFLLYASCHICILHMEY